MPNTEYRFPPTVTTTVVEDTIPTTSVTPIVANSATSVEPIATKPIRTEEKKSEGVSIEPISSSPVAETSPEAVTDKIYLLPEENTPVIVKISVEA